MRSSWTYLLLAASAALAGIATWQAVVSTYPVISTPDDLKVAFQATLEQLDGLRKLQRSNDTIALMMFGALCVAAGAPLYMRGLNLPLKIVSILAAVVVGALTGAAMGRIGFYLHDWLPIKWDALVRVTVSLMGMLLPTGIAAALLTMVCQRAWRKSAALVLGGVVGSVFAALGYAVIASMLLPSGGSDSVLPAGTGSQLLLFTIAPLMIWGMIARQEATTTTVPRAGSIPSTSEAK